MDRSRRTQSRGQRDAAQQRGQRRGQRAEGRDARGSQRTRGARSDSHLDEVVGELCDVMDQLPLAVDCALGSDIRPAPPPEVLGRPFRTGDVIGERYRVMSIIGKGGSGFVYAAEDLDLELAVAVKTLRPGSPRPERAIAAFRRELQLARRITHGNVCRLYDVGVHRAWSTAIPFLTMELIDGCSLHEHLCANGPLFGDIFVTIARQTVNALQAAHTQGIVHADLKPGNIMLDTSNDRIRVVVTDFGLACSGVTRRTGRARRSTGTVQGTPAYMAPEQALGRQLSPATDYFALGCTLYHTLAGSPPFSGTSLTEIASRHVYEDAPPIRTRRREVPRYLEKLLTELLCRDPARRLTDPDEIRKRLAPRGLQRWLAALR